MTPDRLAFVAAVLAVAAALAFVIVYRFARRVRRAGGAR